MTSKEITTKAATQARRGGPTSAERRAAAQHAALKANMARRKGQAKARAANGSDGGAAAEVDARSAADGRDGLHPETGHGTGAGAAGTGSTKPDGETGPDGTARSGRTICNGSGTDNDTQTA